MNTMSCSVSSRYLEFDQVTVDLRHVTFSADGLNDNEYIIFLNVHKAIFTNFKIFTDLSLESIAELLFVETKCTVRGETVPRPGPLGDCVAFIEADRNKSLSIELHERARIVVAKTIFFQETYHKRISGFIDFENRFNEQYVRPDEHRRNAIDREWEIKLLEFT
ncbi:hypothetical protein [Alphabaculovirus myunipunctae]|uniref:Uncharacterized protein n=1 Tax=Mythimna unipuncta nucleopolyhedrovirus TaxID=447897 RepID=A0A2K9VSG2_9ABAC|nr:hypothetical protein [Mythimna unipuncta nucleopolyhedrovirus]AUV65376.1 hypothetical protein [Mythimna unipuncta nucleopolyhedrovirus]